jgi:DNA-binding CsgD family transcriptional regulator
VAAGKSDWAIAQILGISRKTVNFHVENAKRKLGASTRVQAVLAAARTGAMDEGLLSTRDFDWPFG